MRDSHPGTCPGTTRWDQRDDIFFQAMRVALKEIRTLPFSHKELIRGRMSEKMEA